MIWKNNMHVPTELRARALQCLIEPDPSAKVAAVYAMAAASADGTCVPDPQAALSSLAAIPGRPEKPELVPPLQVGRRAMNTPEGRAMLIHALAHIEFNAINLALDAVWRFPGMPAEYYTDWLQVAREEAYHFSLLQAHLQRLGCGYGDFIAHDSLWEMVERTCGDVLARMALVPRTLEARGLDVSPVLRDKLTAIGDDKGAQILAIILRDEIGHVAIGNRWYREVCATRGLDPIKAYPDLALRYAAPKLRQPFNMEARRAAGFAEDELTALIQALSE